MRAKSDRKQQTTADSVQVTAEFMQLGHAGGIYGIHGIHHVTGPFYLTILTVHMR